MVRSNRAKTSSRSDMKHQPSLFDEQSVRASRAGSVVRPDPFCGVGVCGETARPASSNATGHRSRSGGHGVQGDPATATISTVHETPAGPFTRTLPGDCARRAGLDGLGSATQLPGSAYHRELPWKVPANDEEAARQFKEETRWVDELGRVRSVIAAIVLAFCRSRIGREFHAQELRDYVARVHPTAPASADRILRDLRKRGLVAYVLVSRRRSLYRVEGVAHANRE